MQGVQNELLLLLIRTFGRFRLQWFADVEAKRATRNHDRTINPTIHLRGEWVLAHPTFGGEHGNGNKWGACFSIDSGNAGVEGADLTWFLHIAFRANVYRLPTLKVFDGLRYDCMAMVGHGVDLLHRVEHFRGQPRLIGRTNHQVDRLGKEGDYADIEGGDVVGDINLRTGWNVFAAPHVNIHEEPLVGFHAPNDAVEDSSLHQIQAVTPTQAAAFTLRWKLVHSRRGIELRKGGEVCLDFVRGASFRMMFGLSEMRVILVAIGSSGDVHPMVGVGLEFQRRGHDVTLVTSCHFEPLVRKVGLRCAPLGTEEEYQAVTNNPDLSHPRKGTELVIEYCCTRPTREVYSIVADAHVLGETMVVACGLAFGARIAQEKLGVPLVTTFVQPLTFRSVYDTPVYGWLPMPQGTPHAIKRMVFRAIDVFADRLAAPPANAFRKELGLPPVKRIFNGWWMSPQLIIGLFPDWYGPPQPDWPAHTVLTGFPMYDEAGTTEIPQAAQDFFDQGEAPIVFTPGTAMRFGRSFFEASAQACQILGRRGVLLTRFAEHVPESLPDGVVHFDYLPLGQILSRSAAMVHHGGMGTMAQTLKAGIPHLVMPMVNDQPDNARRLVGLGVAESLKPGAYRGRSVAKKLEHLLTSPSVAEACRDVALKFNGVNPRAEACDAVESLAARVL